MRVSSGNCSRARNQSLDNQGNGRRASNLRPQNPIQNSHFGLESVAGPKPDVRGPKPGSNNQDRDDAGAGSSRIEFGADGLLYGEMAALITAKPNRG